MDDQSTAPTLPLNLVDLIVAMAPKAPLEVTTSLSLFNTLPFQLVPTATQSIMHKAFVQSRPIVEPYLNAANFAKHASAEVLMGVLEVLRPFLLRAGHESLFLQRLVQQLCEFGRLDFLQHLQRIGIEMVPILGDMLTHASSGGHVELLYWIATQVKPVGELFDARAVLVSVVQATKAGHVKILDAWRDLVDSSMNNVFASQAFMAAAESGSVDVLNWWKARHDVTADSFPLAVWTVASKHGHVNVLDWAVKCSLALPKPCTDCLDAASEAGHVQVLEWWLRKLGHLECPCVAIRLATIRGHVHVLDWWSRVGEMPVLQDYLLYAMEANDLRVYKWWQESPAYLKLSASKGKESAHLTQVVYPVSLASFGHVHALEKVHQKRNLGPDALRIVAQYACAAGQTLVLQALKGRMGLQIDHVAIFQTMVGKAADFGHVDVLRWCVTSYSKLAKEADWDSIAQRASRRGHALLLDWLWANDLIRDTATLAPFLCVRDCPSILEWLQIRGTDLSGSWADLAHDAAASGHIRRLEWMDKNKGTRCVPPSTYMVDAASINGHWAILEFLSHETLTVFEWSEYAIREAVKQKHLRVVKWWFKSGKVKDPTLTQPLQNAIQATGAK